MIKFTKDNTILKEKSAITYSEIETDVKIEGEVVCDDDITLYDADIGELNRTAIIGASSKDLTLSGKGQGNISTKNSSTINIKFCLEDYKNNVAPFCKATNINSYSYRYRDYLPTRTLVEITLADGTILNFINMSTAYWFNSSIPITHSSNRYQLIAFTGSGYTVLAMYNLYISEVHDVSFKGIRMWDLPFNPN